MIRLQYISDCHKILHMLQQYCSCGMCKNLWHSDGQKYHYSKIFMFIRFHSCMSRIMSKMCSSLVPRNLTDRSQTSRELECCWPVFTTVCLHECDNNLWEIIIKCHMINWRTHFELSFHSSLPEVHIKVSNLLKRLDEMCFEKKKIHRML